MEACEDLDLYVPCYEVEQLSSQRVLPPSNGHCAVAIRGSRLLVIGGQSEKVKDSANTVFVFDAFRNKAWTQAYCGGRGPPPSLNFATATLVDKDTIFVIGGQPWESSDKVDVYALDISSNANFVWRIVHTTGTVPSPRYRHSATSIGDDIWICGGFTKGMMTRSPCADVYKLNRVTLKWTKVDVSNAALLPVEHALAYINKSLWFFGSANNSNHIDVFILDTKPPYAVSNRETRGERPAKRKRHALVHVENVVYLLGGQRHGSAAPRSFYALDVDTNEWIVVPSTGEDLLQRAGHSATLLGQHIWVVGGKDAKDVVTNDVVSISLERKMPDPYLDVANRFHRTQGKDFALPGWTERDIAAFLHEADALHLDKNLIRDYLGRSERSAMLREYIDMMNFKSLDLDDAIRLLVSKLVLPKESQEVDRVVKTFSAKYYRDNAPTGALDGTLKNEAAVDIVATYVLLLNTTLFNPSVSRAGPSLTIDAFVQAIQEAAGHGSGSDIPELFLRQLFKSIKNKELRMRDPPPPARAPSPRHHMRMSTGSIRTNGTTLDDHSGSNSDSFLSTSHTVHSALTGSGKGITLASLRDREQRESSSFRDDTARSTPVVERSFSSQQNGGSSSSVLSSPSFLERLCTSTSSTSTTADVKTSRMSFPGAIVPPPLPARPIRRTAPSAPPTIETAAVVSHTTTTFHDASEVSSPSSAVEYSPSPVPQTPPPVPESSFSTSPKSSRSESPEMWAASESRGSKTATAVVTRFSDVVAATTPTAVSSSSSSSKGRLSIGVSSAVSPSQPHSPTVADELHNNNLVLTEEEALAAMTSSRRGRNRIKLLPPPQQEPSRRESSAYVTSETGDLLRISDDDGPPAPSPHVAERSHFPRSASSLTDSTPRNNNPSHSFPASYALPHSMSVDSVSSLAVSLSRSSVQPQPHTPTGPAPSPFPRSKPDAIDVSTPGPIRRLISPSDLPPRGPRSPNTVSTASHHPLFEQPNQNSVSGRRASSPTPLSAANPSTPTQDLKRRVTVATPISKLSLVEES
eukprot:CAMPEP_0184648188 /NCGR_PEP_ID=MMETSP0308-20130426/5256_1 /TAXON_ID=38269 /ORGANISM="Gloeochaete witrockiana, Strain SAG 46.84" /LENGTH=1031 /DNA_ID=CAMNT_0027079809 /DNA_START=94 /DNA_END=3189 /DNA_ORIENTATION=+